MFGRYGKTLTEASRHYLDWSRTAELLLSSTHRYSANEIITRGFILICTVIPAYLASKRSEQRSSSIALTLAAGLSGFTLSHMLVLIPLIQKRREMKLECDALIEEIKKQPNFTKVSVKLTEVIAGIVNLSLSDDKHGRASQTWGERRALLANLLAELAPQNFDPAFWERKVNDIMQSLKQPNSTLTLRRVG